MKRGQPKRDWGDVTIDRDDPCRWCGRTGETERAHIAGRAHDVKRPDGVRWVNPNSVLALCGPTPAGCHGAFDRGELDLLPVLTLAEQVQAVIDLGGIEAARIRLAPSEYPKIPNRRAA